MEAAVLSREGGGQVEAEPVDVHVGDPVPQRVHDQPQAGVVVDVVGVARAGRVQVPRRVGRINPVVGVVVDPAEAQGRAELVTLGCVVVDHVEDHLDPRGVQGQDHLLELPHLATDPPRLERCRVLLEWGEEADRVVAPVVGQPGACLRAGGDELVDRQQFHGRHAERGQMPHRRGMGHAGVGPAQFRGDIRMGGREPLHVHLVDHGVRVGGARSDVPGPVEGRVHDEALRHVGRGVQHGDRVRCVPVVVEDLGAPVQLAVEGAGVGVQEQLRGVAPQSPAAVIGAVHPIPVPLPDADPGQVAVPDAAVVLPQRHLLLVARLVEQAQDDPLRDLGGKGEVGAPGIGRRPQGEVASRPHTAAHG